MSGTMEEFINGLELARFGKYAAVFLISLTPVMELRAAIPVGAIIGLPALACAAVSVAGNILPIPFIVLFMRRILGWMKRRSLKLGRLAAFLEKKVGSKRDALYKGTVLGLLILVAIPLPGTGAWTGALVAAALNIRLRVAMPAISAGVVIAGALVSGLTYGFKSLL
jgi:uncharacterized membrane protein